MFSAWFPKNKKGSCQKHCTGLKDLQATLIRENPTNTLEKTSTKYPSKKCWKLKGSSRPATWKVPWPTRTLQWYPKSRLFLSGKVFVLEICFSCLGGKQLWSLKPSTKPPHTREQRGPLKGGGDQTCRGHVSISPALHHKATRTGHHLTRIRLTPIGSTLNFEHDPSHKFAHAWGMFGGTLVRTILNTILITGLRMSNLCAEAVHCIHLCNSNVRNQSKRKP